MTTDRSTAAPASGQSQASAQFADAENDHASSTSDGGVGVFRSAIEHALDEACRFETGCPQRLADAIRYAVLAPGKRLRPALVLMAAEACGGTIEQAMPGAVAIEMIHAYSLIHDDLPAMDDDDLRRGRPTVHIAFDEATAILAGDALQPLAFERLCQGIPKSAVAAEAVAILARAAGPSFLVGGQADDLNAELERGKTLDRSDDCTDDSSDDSSNDSAESQPLRTAEHLESIHRRKTGALFSASLELGAVLSEANSQQRARLADYAADLGLAFQVVDDLLDFTADAESLGKRTGKDSDRGKLTYPSLLGLDATREKARRLVESARGHLDLLGDSAWRLDQLARFVLERTH
ncbi:polyprenyl synthetase family protein [Stieleria varia]|uniref:polyprenyl synthetase family protein n=1 Tax=Stieleria varia TaxID=2528005 RepID=UPI001E344A9F|nr:polyprenyl synthetase family protein [Stieleria varia]